MVRWQCNKREREIYTSILKRECKWSEIEVSWTEIFQINLYFNQNVFHRQINTKTFASGFTIVVDAYVNKYKRFLDQYL